MGVVCRLHTSGESLKLEAFAEITGKHYVVVVVKFMQKVFLLQRRVGGANFNNGVVTFHLQQIE